MIVSIYLTPEEINVASEEYLEKRGIVYSKCEVGKILYTLDEIDIAVEEYLRKKQSLFIKCEIKRIIYTVNEIHSKILRVQVKCDLINP